MKETELFFEGKKYVIKPSFRLIQRIENVIDPKGPFEFANELGSGRFKITEVAGIVHCMLGNKVKKTPEEVGDIVMEDVISYIEPIAEFMVSMFTGSDEMPLPDSDGEPEGNA